MYTRLRPNLVALVDAFDFHDHELNSCLGRYDGQVYEALMERARLNPSNRYKVRGCRHRLVEFLIEMGCDLQRRNSKEESFTDALRLQRNRKLMENLIERETIRIDNASGEIKVIVANRF
ncbi:unnamed protein product [Rotaria sordida]|uniref:Acyl-CoA oxidase C-terminal domain-containing protein n=1 Tax=Rotaria sordida TaxID=392033 RepID=A0A819CJ19_9BILA|nr:unnamed protein product [Rotaria sordida]